MTDPSHPPEDAEPPPPRLMSTPFWLALAFGLACVLAALAVVFAARHTRPAPIPTPAGRAATLDAAARA